ncbi:hypothetical protein Hypma_014151 [Hypsizygus marmoreus]|uniref:Uncharacterized protein n=1 Tax=Hypsizygus marmoreus TaxID=39966 RepID=A0A369K806_HYPMA|nr:hypothetical protein Hypma_014151 [Hypsizygus marmoreus]
MIKHRTPDSPPNPTPTIASDAAKPEPYHPRYWYKAPRAHTARRSLVRIPQNIVRLLGAADPDIAIDSTRHRSTMAPTSTDSEFNRASFSGTPVRPADNFVNYLSLELHFT